MNSVSIVIPAYNEEKYIRRLLTSLQKLPNENILEILIVDNGSSDKTKEIVRIAGLDPNESGSRIRLIEESRQGVAWARARGAQEAKGEIVAFLDADTAISDRWFTKLTYFFSRNEVICLSGPSYYYDVPWFTRFSSTVYWWVAANLVSKLTGYMGNLANLAVRSAVLKQIGGIDTSVAFHGDDTNITRRLSEAGKVIFSDRFYVFASGRRFNSEGLFLTAWRYALNFFSEVLVHKQVSKGYTEVR